MTPQRYTLAEIAAALGVSKQAITKRANKEGWAFEAVAVRGGKKRLYRPEGFPRDTRAALQEQAIKAALPAIPQTALSPSPTPSGRGELSEGLILPAQETLLTDKQRLERDARLGVKTAIQRLMVSAGCSQESALHTLVNNARAGQLDPFTTRTLQLARDPRGRGGDGIPSIRTLKRWLGATDLAPRRRHQDMSIPAWAKDFLACYQQPQKPSIESAYRMFCESKAGSFEAGIPSVHQCRRFLDKLGTVTRERGRMGNRELKNIQPFIRRDFSELKPNDVWSADGHTFDAEVQHPFHGRPFRPEITTFVDIATRRAVGWSIDLAESGMAVADGLRHGVERHGIPAVLYVDNGSGYKNRFMQDAATGLVGRIGATMTHSLPYNSQARGVIERLHQTLWVEGARQLPSYMGAAMDREARLEQFKLTRRALKQGGAMPLMPWDLFIQWCEDRVTQYNARPHRSLGGTSPDLSWKAFEAKGWEAERLDDDELATLFRPRVTRKLGRAEIRLFNNIYFAKELEEFHGMEAHISYDIHCADTIWIYLPDGRFICTAAVNGNKKHYFPIPVIEQAKQTRAKGRLAKVDVKREEILAELNGSHPLIARATSSIVIGGRVIDHETVMSSNAKLVESQTQSAKKNRSDELQQRAAEIVQAVPRSERPAAENFAEWEAIDTRIHAGETVSEEDTRWHQRYATSAQYRAQCKKKAAA